MRRENLPRPSYLLTGATHQTRLEKKKNVLGSEYSPGEVNYKHYFHPVAGLKRFLE